MGKVPISFYRRDDVVQISRELLGKFLYTNINGEGITGGMIVETEAYAGPTDKASHAYGNRLTNRTKIMYADGGVAYVYLIYGFHHLFNIITHSQGIPHAVLIRAIEPTDGVDLMLKRRNLDKIQPKLTAGPGVLSKALGITREHTGTDLTGDEIWLEDKGISFSEKEIIASPRVGIAYAAEDALLPWRFRVKGNIYTSPAK